MNQIFNKIIYFLMSLLVFLFGSFDFMLKALLTLMFIDYITGVSRAFVTKKVNSSIGGKGIIKKAAYLCVIAVAVLLDNLLEANGGLRSLIIYSFIFNEMLSILENSSEMGVKIPSILYKSLEKISKEQEDINVNVSKWNIVLNTQHMFKKVEFYCIMIIIARHIMPSIYIEKSDGE